MNHLSNDVSDMLKSYAENMPARFHMPGHKGMDSFGLDVTEISKTDDLTSPSNALLKLEERFCEVYGAKHSFLLVNGSTSGIHAFLLALGTNKKIVVSRECHRSIVHGAALCDDEIIFTQTQGPDDIKSALVTSNADAVILTSPTYYGRCACIAEIADFVHSRNALLFVDAAHGAHFPFSEALPYFPSDKVDMWCTSAHKTLNALTQSAILNLGVCSPFEKEHIRRMLMLENTSSPSFLLMLSLEKALNDALKDNLWDKHIARIKAVRSRFESEFDYIYIEEADDITRLCINVSKTGSSGYEVSGFLEKNNIFCECADERRIVLITTPNDKDEWYGRLITTLQQLELKEDIPLCIEPPSKIYSKKTSIRKAMFSEVEYIPFEKSIGRVCAVCVGVYPPGSPIIAPGEEISKEAVDYLRSHDELYGDIYGILNGTVPCVKE